MLRKVIMGHLQTYRPWITNSQMYCTYYYIHCLGYRVIRGSILYRWSISVAGLLTTLYSFWKFSIFRNVVVLSPLERIESRYTIHLRTSVSFRVVEHTYEVLTTFAVRNWKWSEVRQMLNKAIRWVKIDPARNLSLVIVFALLTDAIVGIATGKSMMYTVPRLVGVSCTLVYIFTRLPLQTD